MTTEILRQLRPTIASLIVFTILTGVLYPLAVTGIAAGLFPGPAGGSLIVREGKVVGSALIGQSFGDAKYFWSRPSATSPVAYNGGASSGSNLGLLNPALTEAIQERVAKLRETHPGQQAAIPIDLVTASGSGLDPHISPAAAMFQVERVAEARSLPADELRLLVKRHIEPRTLGILGEPRVNVLLLNLALDEQ